MLPAAVAQEGDHYYLPVQGRMAMAVEVAAVQGIGGAQGGEGLRAALASTKGVSQEQARKMIGGALHIPSARGVAKRALEGIGWEPGGKRLRFADVYSGIGTMALAVGQAAGQKVQYVAAAERWGKARDVLQAAWGAKVNIRKEAGPKGWVGVNVGRVDVAGVTLPCGPVSKLNGSAEEERQGQLDKRIVKMEEVLGVVAGWEPKAVILESSAELLAGRMEAQGTVEEEVMARVLRGYEIRAQVVKAERMGGVRVRRDRAYWVAIRGGWAGGTQQVP